jgi:hypothetical protein
MKLNFFRLWQTNNFFLKRSIRNLKYLTSKYGYFICIQGQFESQIFDKCSLLQNFLSLRVPKVTIRLRI